ncbi:winged helix-turn-helix domain-containing protein [Nocardiopsis alba]|uniref:winged helix-turn-helix domain-containing protein n=1 Tax=Nocardiopsis alba TaxID=53437 RepID=UPI0033A45041
MDQPLGPDADIIHDAPEPPYRQLAQILIARIKRGDWAPDRPMSSETQLVQEYELARSTVRRTIALLVEDEWAYVVPRRGTYVKKRDN